MKAIVQNDYGTSEVLKLVEIEKPAVKEKELRVSVHAASIHSGDFFGMKGDPYVARFAVGFPRPKNYIPGFDVSGVVEEVGTKVMQFKPGDKVFGAPGNACAEYVCATEDKFAKKPGNISFEEAASIPTSGVTALLGIRDAGKVKQGQKVLINGASGGVGTFAVQIAKSMGAEVTGVCSKRNADMILSIGADHVIDYQREDFTIGNERYDLILDNVANRKFKEYRQILNPSGAYIPNSGNSGMGFILRAFFLSIFLTKQKSPFVAIPKNEQLNDLKELVESGKIKSVIDKTYPLKETPKALDYVGEGHSRGKVVISI
jgi:NADPH:quinone reductase-like Zn-dependent oxidoreductase